MTYEWAWGRDDEVSHPQLVIPRQSLLPSYTDSRSDIQFYAVIQGWCRRSEIVALNADSYEALEVEQRTRQDNRESEQRELPCTCYRMGSVLRCQLQQEA